MANHTESILIRVLNDLSTPSSFEDIIKKMEDILKKPMTPLMSDVIIDTIDNCMRTGVLRMQDNMYFVVPVKACINAAPIVNRAPCDGPLLERERSTEFSSPSNSRSSRRRRRGRRENSHTRMYKFRRNRSRSQVPPRSRPCTRCNTRRKPRSCFSRSL